MYFLTESVWPSSAVPSQRTADGWTTDRRIVSKICLAVEPFRALDCGRADDGHTNSVSFDTICLAVKHRSEAVEISLKMES